MNNLKSRFLAVSRKIPRCLIIFLNMRYLAAGIGVVILALCIFFAAAWKPPVKGSDQTKSVGVLIPSLANTTSDVQGQDEEYAGELFGIQVPVGNYYFIRNTIIVFGNKWGQQPRTKEELDDVVWEQLLLSFLAYRENIVVSDEELDREITKTLAGYGASFDRKGDVAAYQAWLKEKTNESPEAFENQMRHLIQLEKLRTYIKDKIDPPVDDTESYEAFFNEVSTLDIEMVFFDTEPAAEEFYKKASRRKNLWEKEKKNRPGDFKKPGSVSVAFLVDLWGLPQDAATGMMNKKDGDIYPPCLMHEKFAVFRVIGKQPAEAARYDAAKDSYIEKVKARKKFEGYKQWFQSFKESAQIKRYPLKEVPLQTPVQPDTSGAEVQAP